MNSQPDEETLLKELGQAMRAARKQAGLVQRELARKTGYSRSAIANAEAGAASLSRGFYERVDAVLGTKLAHGHGVIRVLRAERLNAASDDGTVPDDFTERCEEIVRTVALRVPAQIRADVAGAWREAVSLPEQTLRIIVEIRVIEETGMADAYHRRLASGPGPL
jgi:transcriptional regulator with XRE-family HTH domain